MLPGPAARDAGFALKGRGSPSQVIAPSASSPARCAPALRGETLHPCAGGAGASLPVQCCPLPLRSSAPRAHCHGRQPAEGGPAQPYGYSRSCVQRRGGAIIEPHYHTRRRQRGVDHWGTAGAWCGCCNKSGASVALAACPLRRQTDKAAHRRRHCRPALRRPVALESTHDSACPLSRQRRRHRRLPLARSRSAWWCVGAISSVALC